MYIRPTVGAEMVCGSVAAVGDLLEGLRPPFDGHLRLGPTCLDGENTAATLLAIEAMADRDADGIAGDGRLELAAAAGCGVGRHFAAFLSASRTSASRVAPSPSSSLAAATAALASAGLKPRLASAERAS